MNRKRYIRIVSSLILAGLFFLTTGINVVLAASNSSANSSNFGADGYRVSPVTTEITVNKGSSTTINVYLQNVSSATEHVQTIFDDFVASNKDNGSPALLLNGQDAPSHSLKQFVSIKQPDFTLAPGAQQAVTITITIPNSVAGGGYYGAVRFAPQSISGNKNVNLSASVASLILIKVPGNYLQKVTISSFGVRQASSSNNASLFFSGSNLVANVGFDDLGQVQEQPFGKILVYQGSKVIGTYDINNTVPAGNVLPSSIRTFNVNLHSISGFGKYKLIGNFGYGTNGQLLSATTTIYVIPVWFLILVIVLIVIIILAIIYTVKSNKSKAQFAKTKK